MVRNILGLVVVATFSLLILGCKTHFNTIDTAKATNTYIVVVGMEYSRFAGDCPGAGYDADRMYNVLSYHSKNIVLLKDSAATKSRVVSELTQAVENAKDGLVILCYSGHGGSDPFFDTGDDEKDGKDEYLCLYDTYLRDNELWKIISKCKGRFFFYSDSCHSQSQFRCPMFKIKPPLSWDYELKEDHAFSLLCWSGCPDTDYSYGSSGGGQFTNAFLRHYKADKTYEQLWEEIKNDRTLRAYENPQSTSIGSGFKGKAVFR